MTLRLVGWWSALGSIPRPLVSFASLCCELLPNLEEFASNDVVFNESCACGNSSILVSAGDRVVGGVTFRLVNNNAAAASSLAPAVAAASLAASLAAAIAAASLAPSLAAALAALAPTPLASAALTTAALASAALTTAALASAALTTAALASTALATAIIATLPAAATLATALAIDATAAPMPPGCLPEPHVSVAGSEGTSQVMDRLPRLLRESRSTWEVRPRPNPA